MVNRPFGNTGLHCSPLGFGAGHIGGSNMTEDEAGTLLNAALDLGINLVDTARGYGLSEERIGRHLRHRRGEFILVSKCGYSIPGFEDWTPGCITAGIDHALRLLQTDHLDVMLFHSCQRDVLQRPGLVEALHGAVAAGKVRFAGYSGENEDLDHALGSHAFRVVETSVNLFDQRSLRLNLPGCSATGTAVIAKRPAANAPWLHAERPRGNYCEVYWERMKSMNLDPGRLGWTEFALRFACHAPGVSTAIVGTGRLEHLRQNVEAAARGPLDSGEVQAILHSYETHNQGWTGQI